MFIITVGVIEYSASVLDAYSSCWWELYKYIIGGDSTFFSSLKVEELGDIKKYLINTSNKKNEKATKKIINMITQEIYEREANKKPCFE